MFIYDHTNYNIDCPKLLFQVKLHVPVDLTKTSSLFSEPKWKFNVATRTFFPIALSLAKTVCKTVDFFLFHECFKNSILFILRSTS